MNVSELAEELIQFYDELLDTEIEFDDSSRISERMEALDSIQGSNITEEQLSALLKSSLHGMAFSLMSGNLKTTPNRRKWELKNEEDLGDLTEIRGELIGKSRSNADTLLFETLVRGWYGQKFNQTFPDLTDCDKFDEGDKKCEFIIEQNNEKTQIVEAKKLTSCRTEDKLVRNFRNHYKKAVKQFNNTSKVLNLENTVSHLIVDISRFSRTESKIEHEKRQIQTTGLTTEEIQKAKKLLGNEIPSPDIDQITLVANQTYEVEGKPRAIIQRAETITEDDDVTDYEGWTVSGLTGYLTAAPVKSLEIHSEAKPQKWLTFGQDGFDGNAFTWSGPEKTGE